MNEDRLPELVAQLYEIVGELETMFPGRHFTPDGHLVGSLGESLAAYHYGFKLRDASSPGHDADKDGKSIEIKATQGNRVALRSCPEHLLVLKLDRTGGFEEIYNGPGEAVWKLVAHKPVPSNGQYGVGVATLRKLSQTVPDELRIPRVYGLGTVDASLVG